MGRYEYEMGLKISAKDYPFYALIQAAMRQADTDNILRLQEAWPKVWNELQERYNSPNGLLMSERIVPAPKHEEDW